MARDAGESLVEILISIMILGVAVSALMFGMGSAATTSGLHARQAQQAEIVRNYVAALQSVPYAACATQYTPSVGALPPGYQATASVTAYASGAGFAASCPAPDQGAQQVRVDVWQADGRVRFEQVVVVKRKPCSALPC